MKHNFKLLLVILSASSVFYGCLNPTAGLEMSKDKTENIDTVTEQLQESCLPFADKLQVSNVFIRQTQEDTVTVQVEIRNQDTINYTFDYRFVWYDNEDAITIPQKEKGATIWKTIVIHGGERRILQAAAPGLEGEKFRIEFRPTPSEK